MRQPLEEGTIRVVRQGMSAIFPASVCLVAAANPCLCGETGEGFLCTCSPKRLESYRARLSGPFLDRIDLQVEVPRLSHEELFDLPPAESSALVRARVMEAQRFRAIRTQSEGPSNETKISSLKPSVRRFLRQLLAFDRSSARAVDRILGVGRTIADLAASCDVEEEHVAEAVQFRRNLWAGQ
jgi:magnesium chelatase family protein